MNRDASFDHHSNTIMTLWMWTYVRILIEVIHKSLVISKDRRKYLETIMSWTNKSSVNHEPEALLSQQRLDVYGASTHTHYIIVRILKLVLREPLFITFSFFFFVRSKYVTKHLKNNSRST